MNKITNLLKLKKKSECKIINIEIETIVLRFLWKKENKFKAN